MTELNEEDVELPEIDPDHPWVEASRFMTPFPMDVIVKFDSVTLKMGQNVQPAAIMTAATPMGVITCFLTPQQLNDLLRQGAGVLREFAPKQSGLVVADQQDMKQAVLVDQAAQALKGKK